MALTFGLLLLIIFFMEIGAGIAAYNLKSDVRNKLKLCDSCSANQVLKLTANQGSL